MNVRPSLINRCVCYGFILLWLVPLAYRNFFLKPFPGSPSFYSYLTSTSNLFTDAAFVWPMPYIQVQFSGTTDWVTLKEEEFFPMRTFGNRSRLFEALFIAKKNEPLEGLYNQQVREELAKWIRRQYGELYPGQPTPLAVRFVIGLYYARDKFTESGGWRTLPLEGFSAKDAVILSTHYF